MEERWPDTSTDVKAHSLQTSYDPDNDFFSTQLQADIESPRDESITTSSRARGLSISMESASEEPTRDAKVQIPIPLDLASPNIPPQTEEARNHDDDDDDAGKESPERSGPARVFVGNAFADELSLSRYDLKPYNDDTAASLDINPVPHGSQEYHSQSAADESARDSKALPSHISVHTKTGHDDGRQTLVENTDSPTVNQHAHSYFVSHDSQDADRPGYHGREPDVEHPVQAHAEINYDRHETETDMNEFTTRPEQSHVEESSTTDGHDLEQTILTKNDTDRATANFTDLTENNADSDRGTFIETDGTGLDHTSAEDFFAEKTELDEDRLSSRSGPLGAASREFSSLLADQGVQSSTQAEKRYDIMGDSSTAAEDWSRERETDINDEEAHHDVDWSSEMKSPNGNVDESNDVEEDWSKRAEIDVNVEEALQDRVWSTEIEQRCKTVDNSDNAGEDWPERTQTDLIMDNQWRVGENTSTQPTEITEEQMHARDDNIVTPYSEMSQHIVPPASEREEGTDSKAGDMLDQNSTVQFYDGSLEDDSLFPIYGEQGNVSNENTTGFLDDIEVPHIRTTNIVDDPESNMLVLTEYNIAGDATHWTGPDKPEELADSWAQALGPSEQALDESWGAAFGDGLDDDGFLEDSPEEFNAAQHNIIQSFTTEDSAMAPKTTNPISPPYPALATQFAPPNHFESSYMTQTKSPTQQAPSAPMEFFADLPTTQPVRSRKPRPQITSFGSQAQNVAPPIRPLPPARASSVQLPQSQYMPFQPPERLDLFPTQEAPRPVVPLPPSTLPQAYATSQSMSSNSQNSFTPAQPVAPPQVNTRYSPAPTQPKQLAVAPTKSPSPVPPQYSTTPSQLSIPSTITGIGARPRPRSPYAAAPRTETTRSASYVKQAPIPGSTLFPMQSVSSREVEQQETSPPNARYSPAQNTPQFPTSTQFKQLPANIGPKDYSRELPSSVIPAPAPNRFAPRTSSPLAQPVQRPQYDRSLTTPLARPDPATNSSHLRHLSLGDIVEDQAPVLDPAQLSETYAPQVSNVQPSHSPRTTATLQGATMGYSPPRRNVPQRVTAPKLVERSMSYAPNGFDQYHPNVDTAALPPRPRTSSPILLRTDVTQPLPLGASTPSAHIIDANLNKIDQNNQHNGNEDNVDYVLPNDQSAMDPLRRWKGFPIFRWGCGGIVSTSFPARIPRYGGGQAAPKVKCVGGEVKLRKLKDLCPDRESLLSFPGPLRSKNKKKDVSSWLSTRITSLAQDAETRELPSSEDLSMSVNLHEKVLLWQLIRIMIEHDGLLAGNTAVDLAVLQALCPETSMLSTARTEAVPLPEIDTSTSSTAESNLVTVNEIRQHLLRSEREKAIWHAVDNKLWGHAMLISSTVDKTIWKQVIQEFVRKEVRNSASNDTHSLAALYEVFAGNWDESVDQLVSLSARTGFHMVSMTQAGHASNSLQNINKWRETLALILANRSTGDEQALLALGKLLAGYGRIEAAHICYIFARSVAHFGGVDDPQTVFSLLGADQSSFGADGGSDLDSVLLSEVFEFGLSLSAPSSASYFIPHLQAYKLYHAYALCEAGSRNEAMQYCGEIATALKSNTRGSPYYHATFAAQLDDLAKRLSQSPKDSGTGWISKPSINKVSGSMGKWFNNFIVGDDADNASTGSAQSDNEAGPFARMAGGTPTISRQSSMADLHGLAMTAPDIGTSRYAPNLYNSFATGDVGTSQQPSYSPNMYGSSPDSILKVHDRRNPSESLTNTFGSPPNMLPFARQTSNLSRYKSNEATTAQIPNLVKPSLSAPYEPYNSSMPQIAPMDYLPDQSFNLEGSSASLHDNLYPSTEPGNSGSSPNTRESNPISRSDSGNEILMANSLLSRPQSQNHLQGYGRLASVNESPVYKPLQNHVPERGYQFAPPFEEHVSTSSGYEPLANHEQRQTQNEESMNVSEANNVGYGYSSGVYQTQSSGGYEPPMSNFEPPNDDYEALNDTTKHERTVHDPSSGYAQSADTYEPGTSTYEPPTYVPYEPQSPSIEESNDHSRKKKSFMDDDDEDDGQAKDGAEVKRQQKAQRDKEADDAVRRAAEADAERDSKLDGSKKSGWLGGWFGGSKKDANAPVVHKAKLGEESSFYFDPETKKWVNRKGGTTPTTAAAASMPPPPRSAPPSRAASGIGATPPISATASAVGLGFGLPTGRPSAPATPELPSLGSMPASPNAGPPASFVRESPGAGMPDSGPPSAPPSRPGTANPSSDIDDLLGGISGGGRKGGTIKKSKRGGRYVDVMAK